MYIYSSRKDKAIKTSKYVEVASKEVTDSDGFLTEYTWYRDENGLNVFVFGDKDSYRPEDGYFDFETESNSEAVDWFDSYTGFDDNDSDISECKDVFSDTNIDDEIELPEQEYHSERTSINAKKLPAIFKLITLNDGTVNLDFGGGRFDNVQEYFDESGKDVRNLVLDPYNRSVAHNQDVIKEIKAHGGADTATCSNVLNVIKEPEARLAALRNIKKLVKPGGAIYITVYEGSKTGEADPTKSGFQLNRSTADYLDEIREVFPDAERKGKLIIAHNS